MKHKHAELIKAWADGAQIQSRWDMTDGKGWSDWRDEDESPEWFIDWEYRIKPEEKKTVVKYLWAIDKGNGFALHPFFVADGSIPYPSIRYGAQRLDWSRTEFKE